MPIDSLNTTRAITPVTYIIAGIALLLAGVIIGVFTDPFLPSSLSNEKKGYNTGYQTGFAAARTLVENSSLGNFFRTENDVRTLSGSVTAINGNRLTMHSESSNSPFDGPTINDRTIVIDSNTKVIKLTTKDSATTQAEFDAFIKIQKTSQATSTLSISREPYVQTTVDASSIQVGDSLIVTAGENVKTVAEFTAQEIKIQPKMFTK